ncbi:AIPR family protein [Kribbella sp. CA-247076]|uniref:AIPR family protein n=1 Tax=Kribbella sp. CA-247076 TaxID=3239941 RepID=UPI003D8F2E42
MPDIPLQIRHIRDALRRDFEKYIDISDIANQPGPALEQAFLSRALTALTLQDLAGCSLDEAVAGVIDGRDDNGIDGIFVSESLQHVWVVQTKWSDRGAASVNQEATLKLQRGLRLLLDGESDQFNSRFQRLADKVSAAIDTPGVKITAALAIMGRPQVSDLVRSDLDKMLADFNQLESLVELKLVGFPQFYQLIKAGVADAKVDMDAVLDNWGTLEEPYRAYYGTMPVSHVAAWYAEHGEKLFSQNIRRSLGLTDVNNGIRATLVNDPEHFWYFNNGITVLCDSLRKSARESTNRTGRFVLTGASVVNGAQTVQSIHAAMSELDADLVAGRVWVRLISLADCPEDFDKLITEATNTQNRVEARDFIALDRIQAELRDEFILSLHKIYVIKRGEPDPSPEAGCSVVEAARALACAHPDPAFAARARSDSAVLWEAGRQGTYQALFGGRPGAHRVWRSVQVLRAVLDQVRADSDERDGRVAKITEHAGFLTAHLVFRQLDLSRINDPGVDWEASIGDVSKLTTSALDWLVYHVNEIHGHSVVPTIFRNAEQCELLAERVLTSIRNDAVLPEAQEVAPGGRLTRERRTNAVIVLVDAGRIEPGTLLEFRAQTRPERVALGPWLAEDPRRGRATWVNNRGAPLLWEADGKRYSPSGLAKHMIRQVGLTTKAVQGTSRWFVPGVGSLVRIADRVRDEDVAGS